MKREAMILVVDDDPGLRCGLYDLLCLYGFDVCTAADGIEALSLMEQDPPDLIVSDIIMPGMNGYQFCSRVRDRVEWLRIPFIFLTAKEEVGDVRYGRELGVEDYIMKPFESEDLVAAVLGKLARFAQLAQHERKRGKTSPRSKRELDERREAFESLTAREREVLRLIARGKRNADIAGQLVIGVSTVKTHVSNILAKLGVGSRVEAATFALGIGLDCLDV